MEKSLVEQLSARQREWVQTAHERYDGELTQAEYRQREHSQFMEETELKSGISRYEQLVGGDTWGRQHTEEEVLAICYSFAGVEELEIRGVVRRIVLDDPSELRNALSLKARIDWLDRGRHEQSADYLYPDVWQLLNALAASEIEVVQKRLSYVSEYLSGGHTPTVLIYNTLRSIILDDSSSHHELKEINAAANVPECYRAVLCALAGIIERDSDYFSSALEYVLGTFRRFDTFDHEKVIGIIPHGIVELAVHVAPDLLEGFDVSQKLPWDSQYYDFLRKDDCKDHLDMRPHSALLHHWLNTLEEPDWWNRNNH